MAGLGNPGARYAGTRHNVGFAVVDRLAGRWRSGPWREEGPCRVAEAEVEGAGVLLAEPQTYMNRSGLAVAPLAGRAVLPPERILVVHDDLDLPFGRLRIRVGGGAGGHRGVLSIAEALGTGAFLRLKLGIGRPEARGEEAEHVLSPFSAEEQEALAGWVERAADAAESIIVEGPSRAMHRYHT
ncbi:MAG: aminoacyl-tRNA hydrolase [Deferrisomatales bacterium]|nr:aminoacyl-tRNA hydrolase [Deferrisomatales bacterium]